MINCYPDGENFIRTDQQSSSVLKPKSVVKRKTDLKLCTDSSSECLTGAQDVLREEHKIVKSSFFKRLIFFILKGHDIIFHTPERESVIEIYIRTYHT